MLAELFRSGRLDRLLSDQKKNNEKKKLVKDLFDRRESSWVIFTRDLHYPLSKPYELL